MFLFDLLTFLRGSKMKAFLRILLHAFIGGAAVGLTQIGADVPITSGNVLLPALASGVTSVISLFTQSPKQQ